MDIEDRLLKRIDQKQDEIVKFAQELVRFKSVNPVFSTSTPSEEGACQEYIAARLKKIGFTDIDMWEPDPVALMKYKGRPGYTEGRTFDNRPNLVGVLKGSGGGRSIFLTGHVDVVDADPKKEAWICDPWAGIIRDGRIYGRGIADMKAGIAAMTMAVESIQEVGIDLKGDVLVGTVVDEETGSMGMLSLVDRGYSADVGIMTEPTDLQISLLCRGIIWGRIRVRGKAGHIEIMQDHWTQGGAVDAIAKGIKIVQGIRYLNEEWASRADKRHPLLPRPCEVSISMIEAGQHPSSFAEEFVITVDAQYLPTEVDENGLGGNVKKEIEEYLLSIANTDSWLKSNPPEFEWFVDADCAEIDRHHELVGIMNRSVTRIGHEPRLSGMEGHTDMSLLTKGAQTPTVNFGPGPASISHQTNEYCSISDLIDATKILALSIVEWSGSC